MRAGELKVSSWMSHPDTHRRRLPCLWASPRHSGSHRPIVGVLDDETEIGSAMDIGGKAAGLNFLDKMEVEGFE